MENYQEMLLKIVVLLSMIKESIEFPCDFIDTRNISSGIFRQDGSYFHNGVTYPKNLITTFDYVLDHFDGKVDVQPHVRGCICKVRPCIRICCRDGLNIESDCVKTGKLSVPARNGSEEIDLRSDQFAVIEGWPCKNMYTLEPAENDYDKWFFEVNSEKYEKEL